MIREGGGLVQGPSDGGPVPHALFHRLLGAEFEALPPTVRRLHQRPGLTTYRGAVEVQRGTGLLSRLFARAAALPPAGEGPISVDIEARDGRETWTRRIAGHAMRSRLWSDGPWLCERLGLVRFRFRITVESGTLVWRVGQVHAFGVLPMPVLWFWDVLARESESEGRYRFDVAASMPFVGLLVHYRGWLQVE